MSKTYLLTGATGFLGSLLALELLEKKNKVIFLGRSKDGVSFGERAEKRLRGIDENVSFDTAAFLEVNLSEENLGISEESAKKFQNKIDAIWHLAANLSFKKEERDEVFSTNILGLKNILSFAERIGAPVFYTSTAYVHGKRGGFSTENDKIRPKGFNNAYEESKFEAEQIINEWGNESKKNSFIIFRPGILVEKVGKAAGFFGYYMVLSSIYKLGKKVGNSRFRLPILFPYNAKIFVNLVPVDEAIEWMIEIADNPESRKKTFHITNPHPFPIKDVVEKTFKISGLKAWLFPAPVWFVKFYFFLFSFFGQFTPVKKVARKFHYYKYYMTGNNRYDMSNTEKIIGKEKISKVKFDGNFIEAIAAEFIKRKAL